MDIALSVEYILYGAEYLGSVTANTKESWEQVSWLDKRISKPTWEDLVAIWSLHNE